MSGRRHPIRLVAVATTLGLLASACSPSPAPSANWEASVLPAASLPTSTAVAPTSVPTTPASVASGLIVLGEGVDGGLGLWRFEAPGTWTALAPLPVATGIARFGDDLAISTGGSVELRSVLTPATAGMPLPIKWQGSAPTGKIVGLDRSPNGTIAIATADGDAQAYWSMASGGTAVPLKPAPTFSFTPLLAWLDDSRLMVLTTDKLQVSRLAVVDVTARTIETWTSLSGVRFFALSRDRRQLAAATDSSVFAGPLEAFMGTGHMSTVATVDPGTVVWGLAFNDSGTQLAILSGAVDPTGMITSIRETGYSQASASWTRRFDSPAPFGRAMAQVWLR